MRFTKTAINSARMLLNQLTVTGMENAKILVMVDNILTNPIKEEEDGDGSKEEHPVTG